MRSGSSGLRMTSSIEGGLSHQPAMLAASLCSTRLLRCRPALRGAESSEPQQRTQQAAVVAPLVGGDVGRRGQLRRKPGEHALRQEGPRACRPGTCRAGWRSPTVLVSEHASMALHDTAGAGSEMDTQLLTSHVGVWIVATSVSGASIAHENSTTSRS